MHWHIVMDYDTSGCVYVHTEMSQSMSVITCVKQGTTSRQYVACYTTYTYTVVNQACTSLHRDHVMPRALSFMHVHVKLASAMSDVGPLGFSQLCTERREMPHSNRHCSFFELKLIVAMANIQVF